MAISQKGASYFSSIKCGKFFFDIQMAGTDYRKTLGHAFLAVRAAVCWPPWVGHAAIQINDSNEPPGMNEFCRFA